jgi:hypothetical protein
LQSSSRLVVSMGRGLRVSEVFTLAGRSSGELEDIEPLCITRVSFARVCIPSARDRECLSGSAFLIAEDWIASQAPICGGASLRLEKRKMLLVVDCVLLLSDVARDKSTHISTSPRCCPVLSLVTWADFGPACLRISSLNQKPFAYSQRTSLFVSHPPPSQSQPE